LTFSGNAEKFAAEAGVKDIKISISHETDYAVATVILCG
jgi:phosphopantetheinyl transferase (holo-ACP synthase)